MAVRSGAGTGVIVSLVVFVLTTVFLLVLTIVFYAGQSKEITARQSAEDALTKYVNKNERSSDAFKGFEAAARPQSVAGYLNRRYEDLVSLVGAEPGATVEKIKTDLSRFKSAHSKDTDTVGTRLKDMYADLTSRQAEIEGLNNQLATLNAQIAEKETQLKQLKDSNQAEVNAVESKIATYRDAAEDYRKRLDVAIDDLNKAKDSYKAKYESDMKDLRDENDRMNVQMNTMKGKIAEFEKARASARYNSIHPELQVDGKIIDAPGSSDQVFIDRGKKDHIVIGMTFEVYGQASQIVVNQQTGEIPRGKASLEVTKVTDTTSTCKIIRAVPGNPLIRGDVIANAVYDPTYKFKFLVHGKFDTDGDGRPTEQEAEYLRSMIIQWGGTVVSGDDLPGDLDFLVLGAEPPKPPPAPVDAPPAVINAWIKQNEANDRYNQLFKQAREAQIPVLNSNRLLILIGYTER